MLDPNMERVIDDEVDVAVASTKRGKENRTKKGSKIEMSRTPMRKRRGGTGQVGERIGSAKSKADKDEDGTGTVKLHLRTVAKLARETLVIGGGGESSKSANSKVNRDKSLRCTQTLPEKLPAMSVLS